MPRLNTAKLVKKPVQVKGKNGKVFTRMMWLKPWEASTGHGVRAIHNREDFKQAISDGVGMHKDVQGAMKHQGVTSTHDFDNMVNHQHPVFLPETYHSRQAMLTRGEGRHAHNHIRHGDEHYDPKPHIGSMHSSSDTDYEGMTLEELRRLADERGVRPTYVNDNPSREALLIMRNLRRHDARVESDDDPMDFEDQRPFDPSRDNPRFIRAHISDATNRQLLDLAESHHIFIEPAPPHIARANVISELRRHDLIDDEGMVDVPNTEEVSSPEEDMLPIPDPETSDPDRIRDYIEMYEDRMSPDHKRRATMALNRAEQRVREQEQTKAFIPNRTKRGGAKKESTRKNHHVDLDEILKIGKPGPDLSDEMDFDREIELVDNALPGVTRGAIEHLFSHPEGKWKAILSEVYSNNDSVKIKLSFKDKDGIGIGYTKRAITYRKNAQYYEVENDLLSIDKDAQDLGMADLLYQRGEQLWKRNADLHGMDVRIKTLANITVGKYAWANKGFNFVDRDERDSMAHNLTRFLKDNGFDPDETIKACGYDSMDRVIHAHQFAQLDDGYDYNLEPHGYKGKGHLGKAFLLTTQSSWEGVKIIGKGNNFDHLEDAYEPQPSADWSYDRERSVRDSVGHVDSDYEDDLLEAWDDDDDFGLWDDDDSLSQLGEVTEEGGKDDRWDEDDLVFDNRRNRDE